MDITSGSAAFEPGTWNRRQPCPLLTIITTYHIHQTYILNSMTEKKRIQKGLASHGRNAYQAAKNNSYAFIAIGNSIYQVSADGSRQKVDTLAGKSRVKVSKKKFSI